MAAEFDMSQYLDLFLQEAEEQLEILEQETLKLEKDPNAERMSTIFRAAHTLKGSSRAMGFLNFGGVTHEMENLLELLRGGQLVVTTAIADALLRCLDSLSQIKASIANGEGDQKDCSVLVAELQRLQAEKPEAVQSVVLEKPRLELPEPPVVSEPQAVAPEAVAPDPVGPEPVGLETTIQEKPLPPLSPSILDALKLSTSQGPILRSRFRLRQDCVMKYARVFMAVQIVQDGGELLATIPDVEGLEEERFDSEFEIYFQHKDSPAILKTKLAGISEVEEFDVELFLPGVAVSEDPNSKAVATAQDDNKPAAKKAESNQTVRVDVTRLDELMNLVGELVIDRTRIAQIGAALSGKYQSDESIAALAETVSHISRITTDLQDQLMKARMLPIDTVFNRFPRMVRDLANKVGKDIELELLGGETELDRSVIEVIGDPLLHILRNSVDHGIETPEQRVAAGKPKQGRVTVMARHEENHIVIEIRDDGRGIDPNKIRAKAVEQGLISKEAAEKLTDREAFQFIFVSGLSTAEKVTDVSGRGVGMDIVKSNVQKLGGIIDLESTVGVGTRFELRLPLTLAIIRGLLVSVSKVVYVLPLGSVVETLLIPREQIQSVNRREVVVIRGATTPLVWLKQVFSTRMPVETNPEDSLYVVIVGLAEQRIGLVVDRLIGEQEVVIKSLSRYCGDVHGVSGATILGDGNVALIADVSGLITGERR